MSDMYSVGEQLAGSDMVRCDKHDVDDMVVDSVEFTVGEISKRIKSLIDGGFSHVRVRGEISGYRGPHSSGHCYFALKDSNARLDAIVWRGTFSRLCFKPEEGVEIVATGRLTTYPGKSGYQIIIEAMECAGLGASMILIEERKRQLAAEGLFNEERKRRLPFLPQLIGVVTSPNGAVISDILHRLEDRCPRHVLLWPVRVQGDTCAEEVAAAIDGFNSLDPSVSIKPDLIIVARGGGSYAELCGFNEEIVVRAVANSIIPVISAVGHETDWTLIDLVADHRAPTPTAAAEIATPVRTDLLKQIASFTRRCEDTMYRSMNMRRQNMRRVMHILPKARDILSLPYQRVDMVASQLMNGLQQGIYIHALKLSEVVPRLTSSSLYRKISRDRICMLSLAHRVHCAVERLLAAQQRDLTAIVKLSKSLGYRNVLARGYALIYNEDGKMVRSVTSISTGNLVRIELSDGVFFATVEDDLPANGDGEPSLEKELPREVQDTGPLPGEQGNLF